MTKVAIYGFIRIVFDLLGPPEWWWSVVVLLLLNVTTYYNTAQAPWLYGTIGVLVLLLVHDRYRRKNAWRAK